MEVASWGHHLDASVTTTITPPPTPAPEGESSDESYSDDEDTYSGEPVPETRLLADYGVRALEYAAEVADGYLEAYAPGAAAALSRRARTALAVTFQGRCDRTHVIFCG